MSEFNLSAINREKLDQGCERGVLGLVLAVLVYSPLALGAGSFLSLLVLEWLTVALLAVWGCRFIVNPKHRLLWPWVCWPVLGFMLYATGRYLALDAGELARQEHLRVLIYGFVFFAVLNNLHHQETTQIIGLAVVALGTLLAMYAVVQYMTASDHVWGYLRAAAFDGRGSGSFLSPNHLAGYLEMLLPLALAHVLTGRMKELSKVLAAYAALVIFTGLLVTFSRWGWLAAGISVLLWLVWTMRQFQYRLPGLLLIAGFLVIILLGSVFKPAKANVQPGRLARAMELEAAGVQAWSPAISLWKDHFWWGAGPGAFEAKLAEHRPADPQLRASPERVHNDFLNVLIDWGFAGGALLGAVWLLFFGEVVRSWRFVRRSPNDLRAKRSNKASFVLGGSLGLLAVLIHSWFDTILYVPANALLAATLLALVTGHFRFATERHWHTIRWPLRVPVAIILAAGLAYLSVQAGRHTAQALGSSPRPGAENSLTDAPQAKVIAANNASLPK